MPTSVGRERGGGQRTEDRQNRIPPCPLFVCSLSSGFRRVVPAAALVVFALGLTGCGSRLYPVRGTVTLDDGTPLTKGLVVFERVDGGPAVTARGEVRPDGTYELSTSKPGDGVPAGRYKALVNPLELSDVPDEQKKLPFDVKYTKLATSGLEFEVKPGDNQFDIKLDRPHRGRR